MDDDNGSLDVSVVNVSRAYLFIRVESLLMIEHACQSVLVEFTIKNLYHTGLAFDPLASGSASNFIAGDSLKEKNTQVLPVKGYTKTVVHTFGRRGISLVAFANYGNFQAHKLLQFL